MSITALSLVCLSLNVYHEARGEPLEGQVAVAQVTMNRVASDNFPDDVCGVVWQSSQFSWTHDGKSDKPRDKDAWALAQAVAQIVSTNNIKDQTKGATDYHADYVVPYWADGYQHTTTIGSHIFYTRGTGPKTSIRPKARP